MIDIDRRSELTATAYTELLGRMCASCLRPFREHADRKCLYGPGVFDPQNCAHCAYPLYLSDVAISYPDYCIHCVYVGHGRPCQYKGPLYP